MLDAMETSRFGGAHADSQPSLGSVQMTVLPPPPPALYASADGLKMGLLESSSSKKRALDEDVCHCHEALRLFVQQQSREVPVSGSLASVDELNESGRTLAADELSTCASPTCLLLHCLGFKIGDRTELPSPPTVHVAPSMANESFVARVQAVKDRLGAVEAAQSTSHVEVSDVTQALISRMKDDWESSAALQHTV